MVRPVHAIFASLFLLLPIAAPAQETRGAVRETARAVLVEVPVRVVDRSGNPLHGLTAADFELYDDGKKQSITAVDVVDLAGKAVEPPALGEEVNPAARRHFLILFDLSFSAQKGILAAQRAAKEFVLAAMGDRDLAAVATFSLEQGLRLIATFSSDRAQLARAIETLGAPAHETRKTDPLAFVYDPNRLQIFSTEKRSQGAAGALIETLETYKALDRASVDRFARTRVTQLTQSLGGLAMALDAVEGRKDVVFLSEGFESRLLVGTHDTDQERQWIIEGTLWNIDSDKRFGNGTLLQDFSTLTNLFRRSDCIVHVVDIRGIAAQGAIGENANVGPAENSLFELANDTGGEVFRNANNFKGQFDRLLSRTSLVYVLSFSPRLAGSEGKFHELKVNVRSSGARVSARAGYYESRSFRALTPLERSLSAANVITQEKLQGDLPVTVMALSFADERISRVPVFLRLSPEAILGATAKDGLELGIYVYVTNEKGELADYFTRSVALDLSKAKGALARGGLTYYGTCHLLPGRYRVRAYVRDERSGRFGFRNVPIDVPEVRDGQMQALPPIFLSEESGGLKLKDSGENSDESAEPLQVGETFVIPQESPTVSSGNRSRICLMIYQKTHSASSLPLEITMQIVDASGTLKPAPKVSLVSRSTPGPGGLNKMILDFEPPSLPTGEYSLRVMFRDAADHASHAESETLFRVL